MGVNGLRTFPIVRYVHSSVVITSCISVSSNCGLVCDCYLVHLRRVGLKPSHRQRVCMWGNRHRLSGHFSLPTLFARSHTIRTVAHYAHTIRTVAHYSHGRTLFAHYSHGSTLFAQFTDYWRHRHTKFAHYSHQFAPQSHYSRGGGEPIRTHARSIRTVHTRSHL